MSATVYARLLPYEAEIWMQGLNWRGDPANLAQQLERSGARQVLMPTTVGNPLPRRIADMAVQALPLGLASLPQAARLSGVAGLYRTAPPFCEGEMLAREVQGGERAVLLLLGPETVGWALHRGRLRDAFRSLDEEAIGGCTTGAVESRWAAGRFAEDGDAFAHRLFREAGLKALPDGLPAWRHRLRMAVGRLAAALAAKPDAIYLGGDQELVVEARETLEDLAPVKACRVAWGLAAWAEQREE